jgi:AP-3 complex subunit mu
LFCFREVGGSKTPSGEPEGLEKLSAIFIVNQEGLILIEKQYRERVQRPEIDLACDGIRDKTRIRPGIIPHGEYSILLQLQDEIWLVGVCEGDEFALFGVSVLQYVGELFAGLLHDSASETSVKGEYHVVHQILDLAVDASFPFLNESNTILHLLTRPMPDYATGWCWICSGDGGSWGEIQP